MEESKQGSKWEYAGAASSNKRYSLDTSQIRAETSAVKLETNPQQRQGSIARQSGESSLSSGRQIVY